MPQLPEDLAKSGMDFPIRPIHSGCEIEILDELVEGQGRALPVVFTYAILQSPCQGLQTVQIPDAKTAVGDATVRGYIVV